jgi:hypothetical protein
MNVSGYNVATENLNSVINESLKLVGERLAQTPTRKIIENSAPNLYLLRIVYHHLSKWRHSGQKWRWPI